MSDLYILDNDGNPVQETDLRAWSNWYETASRRVALYEHEHVKVSTVFLGMDHRLIGPGPPVLWETMVFGGEYDDEQERYTSREAALAGHARWVAKVKGIA